MRVAGNKEGVTYNRFSSERPRNAPGLMVLIKLFRRSLGGKRTHKALGWGGGREVSCFLFCIRPIFVRYAGCQEARSLVAISL